MLFGIRLRLAVLALALATPTVVYQLWASAQGRERAIARASTRVEELAKLAAAEEDDSLQEASNLLRVLRHVPAITNAALEDCHSLLREITNEHPRVDLISVERADGSVACTSAQPIPPTFNLADRAWFREATAVDAPATVVSDLLVSRARGSLGVVVASGLQDARPDGRRGAISALMNLTWFADIATKLSNSTGALVQIVDAQSGVVIAPENSNQPGRQFVAPQLISAIRQSSQGVVEVGSADGEIQIVGYHWLPADQSSHSTVLVSMLKSVIVRDANRQLIYGLVTTTAAILMGVVGAWCVAEVSIIRPLSALARMATQLGGGNLEARAALHEFSVSELKILGDTLNRAVEQIQLRDCELEKLTLKDPLTGLANRRCFDMALQREWARAERIEEPLTLLMVDVDYFKLYNDTYGHVAGDGCLRRISDAIARRARSAFDVIARYGGEEIALLVPGIEPADAIEMAERVVAEVMGLELPHEGSPLHWVSVSVGLATLKPSCRFANPQSLIEAADRALYEAKRTGRNRASYADQLISAPALS